MGMQIAFVPYVRVMGHYAHVAAAKEFVDSFYRVALGGGGDGDVAVRAGVLVAEDSALVWPAIDEGSIEPLDARNPPTRG